ncbi:hypothetical protein PybrP1_003902 [[Pythium] brassicae (nom. inval.)]|nr:hypothetical protein PybrP1_003902 [[Pythium] brassicae (nom. inval.)]
MSAPGWTAESRLQSPSSTSSSTPSQQPPPPTSFGAATVEDAQDWSSTVVAYTLRFDHVALDISSHRVLYHLKLELAQPIPPALLEFTSYLCLGYPLGGIWKITKRCDANRFLTCIAWRKAELSREDVAELAAKYAASMPTTGPATAAAAAVSLAETIAAPIVAPTSAATGPAPTTPPPPPPAAAALFDWKMQLGTWKRRRHWFVREVGPLGPAAVSAKLFAGLTPIEVSLTVNSVTAVDTVAQRFTADVTWELTLRGITTMREDSVLRELLDLLEFDDAHLEFSNLTEVHAEKPLVTVLAPESERIQYAPGEPGGSSESVAQRLHQLKYSRRLLAEFSEEMTLHSFPFDQQKLTFAFHMGKCLARFIPVAPPSGSPGRFALENFKLGNVWQVACGDKLFVGDVVDSGATKLIRFEMMLQRRSAYYLTNVGVPAAIITYLCFISYAPLAGGSEPGAPLVMMDTGARLQIVLTLLLTAVTFKYNLAALIPQVSYFTTLDKYVFVCFIITCAVAVENALYPLVAGLAGPRAGTWNEYSLLWFSVGAFTLLNAAWGLYLWRWIRGRNARTRALLVVAEYVRVIATAIPNRHKHAVLRGFLQELRFDDKLLPEFVTTKRGDLFVKLPSDSPAEEQHRSPHEAASGLFRKQALRDLPAIQQYFKRLDPDCTSPAPSPVSSPAHRTQAGGPASVVVNIHSEKTTTAYAGAAGGTARAG